MTMAEQFGKNLRRVRDERRLTQEALGHLAGVHRTEISLLERAERVPRLTTVAKLATGLKTTPEDLMRGVWDAHIS